MASGKVRSCLTRRQAQAGQEELAVLRVTEHRVARHDDSRNGSQPVEYRSCLVDPPHMRVARSEIAIWVGEAWILLNGQEKLRCCLVEAPAGEVRGAYYKERRADAGAGTEAQRSFNMLDRDIGLARPFLSMPLRCQPRAKLGLSARARSINAIIAPISSPK